MQGERDSDKRKWIKKKERINKYERMWECDKCVVNGDEKKEKMWLIWKKN